MIKRFILSAALVSAAAIAHAPGDQPTTQTREGAGDPDQIVCRNETEIGSRVNRRRVCRTRAEWAALQAQGREITDRVQYFKPQICNPDGIGGSGKIC